MGMTPMRRREFRPTLDGRLEDRLVLDGAKHPAVVFTTNGYSNALGGIDRAVDRFAQDPGQKIQDLMKSIQQTSKTIPFGGKVLYPVLKQAIVSFSAFSDG